MSKKKVVSKTWGNASLVTGILSILFVFMPYFGLPLGIIAVVGANKQKKVVPTGNATAGNVLGIIGIIINGIMLIFALFFISYIVGIGASI